ncbi:MAG: glycosyltransferase family A protein [Saprospiraceae bacterium]
MHDINSPKVSIIVPNYNHAAFLRTRIESILGQTYQDYELIIIDDCSSDGSMDVLAPLRSHKKTSHFITNSQNSGNPFAQWKKGIELSKGEFIWIAESDDIAHLSFLEKLIFQLEKHPTIGIATCYFDVIDESGELMFNTKKWLPFVNEEKTEPFMKNGKKFLYDFMLSKNLVFNASGAVFRKKFLPDSIEQFTQFKQAGDLKFWVDILQKSDLCIIKETLNQWRIHEKSVTGINKSSPIAILEQYQITRQILKTTPKSLQTNNERAKQAFEELINRWWTHKNSFSYNTPKDVLLHIKTIIEAIKSDNLFLLRLLAFVAKKIQLQLTRIPSEARK